MNRFSNIVSVIVESPSACVIRAMYWACISVGNSGCGSVVTSFAVRPPDDRRTDSVLSIKLFDLDACFAELFDDGRKMLGPAAFYFDLAVGYRRRDDEMFRFRFGRELSCAPPRRDASTPSISIVGVPAPFMRAPFD